MNTTPAKLKALQDAADDLQIVPRLDSVQAVCDDLLRKAGKFDAESSVLLAEKLRYTYAQVLEIDYPEMMAESGQVLPIDTSVPPSMNEYEVWLVSDAGFASWIDDDGMVAPSSAVEMTRSTGTAAEMGHAYTLNWFDLERAASGALVNLPTLKAKHSRRYHAAKTNWVWLFGDASKALLGLATHPNIPRSLAALNASDSSTRLWTSASKTSDEILADLATLIDGVPQRTLEKHHTVDVFLPHSLIRECKNRTYTTPNGGVISLWEHIKALYSGDDSGQGKVSFHGMLECDASRRVNPETGTDTSGISGDFIIACPAKDPDVGCFMRMRPFTQRPPQEVDFNLKHLSHSKVGGARIQEPLAFGILTFGTT